MRLSMARLLRSNEDIFSEKIQHLLNTKLENNLGIENTVKEIITNIGKNGDTALIDYTNTLDKRNITSATQLKILSQDIQSAYEQCDPEIRSALEQAADRITTYHNKQKPTAGLEYTDETGTTLGFKWTSIESAGLYVPGGTASYPSSVLMNAIPAKVAGVERITMVVPAPNNILNPLILTAAHIAGITEIYTVGGAQAIAALAFGTKMIAPVDIIVGPGNAYVANAKKQLFGTVGIDMIAGPSEILVLASKENNPQWIAADLLSQAEHDPAARAILVTDSEIFAQDVIEKIEEILPTLEREDIAQQSWDNNSAIIIINKIEDAPAIINKIAPEHLEIAISNPEKVTKEIRNAGAIFIGEYTTEAIGDYIAGPSHVLPTASTARFSSGLSVYDFLKRSSIISCTKESFHAIAEQTELLATAEGLNAHALSIKLRKDSTNDKQ